MGTYVKWSWLLYMATIMWSSLIINDWNNDFQNNIIKVNVNESEKETINASETQPPSDKQDVIEKKVIIREPYKLVKKGLAKEELKSIDLISITNDKQTTNDSSKYFENVNLIFKLLEGSQTWCSFNWFWNCIAFIILILVYITARIFWKYGQNKIPKEISSNEKEILNITNSFTKHKKLTSKIPTYKFKRSISDMAVSSYTNHHQNDSCESINSETSNITTIALKNNHLIQEINECKNQLKDEEEMCFNLRQELIHIHDEHERDREKINRKLEAVTIEKKELSKQLASALKENNNIRHDLDEITLSRDNTQRKLSRIKEELRKSTKEKCNLNKQIIVMRKQNISLHQTLERCRREIKQHQEKVNELEREILQLKTRLQCASVISKKNAPLKDHSEDIWKSSKCVNQIKTHNLSSGELSTKKLSKFDIYSNVKNRIKNIENDIVNWETKNSDQLMKTQRDDLQISEIFHTCCDNSNDDSSEYGLTTDAFYSDRVVTFYRKEEYQTAFTDSTTTTTSDDVTTSVYSGKLSTACSDDLININDPAFEIDFNEEYNRLMEKLQNTEASTESTGIITKQTAFLRKYFQDSCNIQDGFNYFSNDIEGILNNENNGKILSNKRCRVSVHVCPEQENNDNKQENKVQNSLAYKLLSNFDPPWQGSISLSPTAGSKIAYNSSPESRDECNNSDLCSLD